MSGHSKWKNIMHKKEKTDAQRAKVFTKIGKEMAVAIREGGADPVSNSKLRDLIQKAKANNVPNDNIDRIIKKFSGDNAVNYEEMVYEGYGPNGVAVINDYAIKSTTIASGAETYPQGCIEAMERVFRTIAVPASEIALDLGNAKCMNVVLFGAMCDSLGCPQIDWEQVVADTVPEKVKELNIRAFRAGREAAQKCR